jgi:glycosyltransferase involved in cell wall biosynthesis
MRHEVAIYTTSSATPGLYDRSHGRAGGAERQMTLLARALAERGHRVAHVVYPPRDPVSLPYPLTLVHREPYAGDRGPAGSILEARSIWRALRAANADVVVCRTASPLVAAAAAFCKLHRRAFIFSSSNISDFTLEKMSSRRNRLLYRTGIRLADVAVVQSQDQVVLAHDAFPRLRVVRIPSFAEPAPAMTDGSPEPDAFLWFGRCVAQKQPMSYVALARALPQARFVMVPVPEAASSRELDELRAAARDVTNLTLLDPRPHAKMMELISSAVAVVNTSVLEGMPNTFLEAWARGTPVLTLEFDPDEVVARNGLGISAAGDWDRFVEGARELWEGRRERGDFARRARSYVSDVHSMEAVGARWSELIAEVRRLPVTDGVRRVVAPSD